MLRDELRDEPCPTCSGPIRETVGMVCQTCGTDYGRPEAPTLTEPLNPYWHGMLCADTLPRVLGLMHQLLDGNYFTLVTANSYDENSDRYSAIDVWSSQWLTGQGIRDTSDRRWTGICWSTPRQSMGLHVRARTVAEAREGKPHDYIHLHFEPGCVEIDHFAPAGYRLLWVMAVERHDREDGNA